MGNNGKDKIIKIGNELNSSLKGEIIKAIIDHPCVFAWSYKEMPRIDTVTAQNKISLYLDAKLVKQKLRRIKPKWPLKIKEEITNQLGC